MNLDIVVLFFIFGVLLKIAKVNFEFPKGLSSSLMLILLLAIGLKGGVALKEHASFNLLIQGLWVISLGLVIPLIAFPILRYFGQLDRINAASIAAHYGSVSVGTFAVALVILESSNISYESYFSLFVVLLEIPAIIVGLILANKVPASSNRSDFMREVILSPGIVFMLGGLLIGCFSNNSISSVLPLFKNLFGGILALFLLEMGMIAATRIKDLKQSGIFIVSFAIFMPLLSGLIGGLLGHYVLGLSIGGIALLSVLAASASYIAVPASMRVALPEANHGLSIAASLGITFPFNVLVGIPIYILFAQSI